METKIEIGIWRLLEMTEREKMLSGKLYDPTDKELEQLRLNARKLARKYNSTDEDQTEEQARILQELLPTTEELPYLQAPVYFDCAVFRYQMGSEKWHQRSLQCYHWKENC